MHHELAGINTSFIFGLYMPIYQSTIGKERGKALNFVRMHVGTQFELEHYLLIVNRQIK